MGCLKKNLFYKKNMGIILVLFSISKAKLFLRIKQNFFLFSGESRISLKFIFRSFFYQVVVKNIFGNFRKCLVFDYQERIGYFFCL